MNDDGYSSRGEFCLFHIKLWSMVHLADYLRLLDPGRSRDYYVSLTDQLV